MQYLKNVNLNINDMNKVKTFHLIVLLTIVSFSGCELMGGDENPEENTEGQLYVKFENSSESEYTITSIQILDMGVAGTLEDPTGNFSANLLEEGKVIAPGSFIFLYMDIPNSHYAYCRLGVDDGTGNQIILTEQENYANLYEGTITHWGSDERTVTPTIVTNTYNTQIYVRGWAEWAGIE